MNRWLDRAVSLVPLLFAIPVLGGAAISLGRLISTADPDAEFGNTVNADAAALYLGQPLYQDPQEGYTGILYTPLLPVVVSALYRVSLWTGWPLVIVLLAALAMAGITARLAHRPSDGGLGERLLTGAEALGIGALGFALVTCVQLNGIYGGNGLHDQVAWALGLAGLLAVPAAAKGSGRATVLAILLLTAAVWTKQNAALAGVAAALWLVLAGTARLVSVRRAAGLVGVLLGLNLALLGLANVLTSGWEAYFNFLVPSRHPLGDLGDGSILSTLPKFLREELLPATALAIAFGGVLGLTVASRRLPDLGRRLRAPGRGPKERAVKVAARLRGNIGRLDVVLIPLLVTLGAAIWLRATGVVTLHFLIAPNPVAALLTDVVVPALGLLALFALVLWLRLAAPAALRGSGRPWRWAARLAGTSPEGRLASILSVSILVGAPAAFYLRQKIGADDHYYTGIAWALVLLGALAWRAARSGGRGGSLVAGGAVLALFAAMALVSPYSEEQQDRPNAVNLPSLDRPDDEGAEQEAWLTVFFPRTGLVPVNDWTSVDPGLRRYARRHLVFHGEYGDLNFRDQRLVWPNYDNFSGNLAGGRAPGFLLEGWLNRRFDAVNAPFATDERSEEFVSGSGLWEENYLWKLNEVVAAGYIRMGGTPEAMVARRPGPHLAPWMRYCFGPFEIAGTALRINRGGGFWCQAPGASTLELRKTPAFYSDLRTDEAVRSVEGTLVGELPRGRGFLELGLEARGGVALRLRADARPREGVRVRALSGDRVLQSLRLPAPRGGVRARTVALRLERGPAPVAELALEGRGVTVRLPSFGEKTVLRLGASGDSGAVLDLSRLRIESERSRGLLPQERPRVR